MNVMSRCERYLNKMRKVKADKSMKIKYVIGKKIYEEDYSPHEKSKYIVREEEYFFDTALQYKI